jgi:hypothetical protein
MWATHLPMSATAIIHNCLSGRVARVIDKERGVLATGWGALAANKCLPVGGRPTVLGTPRSSIGCGTVPDSTR